MALQDGLLLDALRDIKADIREVRDIATDAATNVEVLKVQVAELHTHQSRKTNRWPLLAGLVTVGGSLIKVIPFLKHKG